MPRTFTHTYELSAVDDAGSAVVTRSDGLTFPVPIDWLPEGVRPGQTVEVEAESGDSGIILRISITDP
jgi:hypothetical protein